MRLLVPVAFASAMGLGACDNQEKKAPIAPRARSQAVHGPAIRGEPTTAPPEAPSAEPPKQPRQLCAAGAASTGRRLPNETLSARAKPGESLPSTELTRARESWLWVNFWAAWCAPCKEEIPRLLRWQKQLHAEGTPVELVFVSMDDDERQLDRYLAAGGDGLSSTLWLREGKERQAWLEAAALEADPELPLHLLIGPNGKVVCTIQGAVEDGDYSVVKALLAER